MKMRISLFESLFLQDNIKDIVLYRTSDDAVVSANYAGYSLTGLNTNFENIRPIVNEGKPLNLGFITSSTGDFFYYYPVYNKNRGVEDSYLGFAVASLKSTTDFFNIDIDKLNPNGTFMTYSGDELVSVNGTNILSHELLFNFIDEHNYEEASLHKIMDNGPKYFIYHFTSKNSNLTYIYYEPYVQPVLSFFILKNLTLFPVVILLIICIIVIFIFILYLVKHTNNVILKSIENTKQYEVKLFEKQDFSIRENFVPEKYFSTLSLKKNYASLLISVEPTPLSKETLLPETKGNIENYLTACKLSYLVSIQDNSYVLCIINYDDYDILTLARVLNEVLHTTMINNRFNIFHTYCSDNSEALHKSILFMKDNMRYSYIYEYGKSFSQSLIHECEKNEDKLDPLVMSNTLELLVDRKTLDLDTYISNCYTKIISSKYSYREVNDFVTSILYTIKNFFMENSTKHPIVDLSITEVLGRFSNLKQCISYIQSCIEFYNQFLIESTSPINIKYMDGIIAFINEHLDTVTLGNTADYFKITPSHLSRLFKENADINFSDYVSEKKLQQAKLLLEENNKMSIREISQILGYNTPAYFSTKFKERFGLTPGTYRKNHILYSQS